MRIEKKRLGSDGGNSDSKKRKRVYSSVYGGVCVLRLDSGGRFCIGAFGRSLVSVAVKTSPHLIHFKRKSSKLFTLNVI